MGDHALLDEDDLRMSLDDDLRALEALDAGDVGCRPSALLDRRMEEEFGGAFFASCLRASELLSGDDAADALLDGAAGFVDMEQMLLSESEAFLSAHFGGGATVDEMLRRLDAGASADAASARAQGLRAELTARHFLHAATSSSSSSDAQQQRLVLLKQAITAGSASAIFNMPPRYFESAASSPQKRRAHRRTFGERQHTFAFSGAALGTCTAPVKQEPGPTTRAAKDEHLPLALAAGALEAASSAPVTTPNEPFFIKEEVETARAAPALAAGLVAPVVQQDQDVDMEDDAAPDAEELFRAFTPEPSFAGFRSITDDYRLESDESDDDDNGASLRTPLRRALSTPAPSRVAELEAEQQRTPLQHQAPPSRSMSPADAFDKVAGVVQVARDSPARLGKFEWRIGGAEAAAAAAVAEPGAAPRTPATGSKKRPNLAAQLGCADAADCAAASEEATAESAGSAPAPLPPRYFRGGTSSPQKRRAHSTTFGSFARSFSFTGSAPSDL